MSAIAQGVIANLLARVAALEQQAAPPPGEQLTANYLTIDANGQIGATFTGKIEASELDLIAPTAPSGSPINWLRQSDGALLAQIISDGSGNLTLSGGSFSFTGGTLTAATIDSADINTSTMSIPEGTSRDLDPTNSIQWQASGVTETYVQGANGAISICRSPGASIPPSSWLSLAAGGGGAADEMTAAFAGGTVVAFIGNTDQQSTFVQAGGFDARTQTIVRGQYGSGSQTVAATSALAFTISDGTWTLGSGAYTNWMPLGYIFGTGALTWGVTAFTPTSITITVRNYFTAAITFTFWMFLLASDSSF